jgi:hypothetical protein
MPAAAIPSPVDTVYTPSKGSAERIAILDGLRAHQQDKTRFIVHAMQVFHRGTRAIAMVNAEAYPARIASVNWVLVREGNGPWNAVWGVGDGGSNACLKIADAYRDAQALARRYGADPAELMPDFASAERDARAEAARDEGLDCVGDLESF